MNTQEYVKNEVEAKDFNKILEEALKPMSIKEIQEKFNLSFPFQVKRVQNSSEHAANAFPVGETFNITEIWHKPCVKKGMEYVTNNKGKVDHQSAELQDYRLAE